MGSRKANLSGRQDRDRKERFFSVFFYFSQSEEEVHEIG